MASQRRSRAQRRGGRAAPQSKQFLGGEKEGFLREVEGGREAVCWSCLPRECSRSSMTAA